MCTRGHTELEELHGFFQGSWKAKYGFCWKLLSGFYDRSWFDICTWDNSVAKQMKH